jgi:hypothetical protein
MHNLLTEGFVRLTSWTTLCGCDRCGTSLRGGHQLWPQRYLGLTAGDGEYKVTAHAVGWWRGWRGRLVSLLSWSAVQYLIVSGYSRLRRLIRQ